MTASNEIDRERLLADLLAGRLPDARGRFGPFGGRYVPETLVPAHERLEQGVRRWLPDAEFQRELTAELNSWVGRPTALTHAPRLSARWGADVWLKREDLAHTGAHKINNALGQALLAKRLGARRIIAETGAGQHGVATAAACARVGLPCTVYMGEVDTERQAPNVGRMKLLGAKVVPVMSGDRTLRAAIDDDAFPVSDPVGASILARRRRASIRTVRELQAIIGRGRAQLREATGGCRTLIACVGGGSTRSACSCLPRRPQRRDHSVEAGGTTAGRPNGDAGTGGGRAASLSVLLGCGQRVGAHSVSAGLGHRRRPGARAAARDRPRALRSRR
jgi:tryptophan synthase beta chain